MARILTSYYRPKPTGLCKRLFMAIQALLDKGHIVHYLALEPFPIQHPGIIFHRFPWPVSKADSLLFWAIFHLCAPLHLMWIAMRYRISHIFAFSASYGFLLKPAALVRRLRVTCFFHGDAVLEHQSADRSGWIAAADRLVEGVALLNAHAVGLQAYLMSTILSRHPFLAPEKVDLLPNNMSEEKRRKKAYTLPLCIGMVGALNPVKNHTFALALAAELPKDRGNIAIYGSGPLGNALQQDAGKLGVSDRVHFMGWVPSQSIWPQIDLLLMPSLNEGMPEAVLEAIANGVAVIASDIPAHRGILPGEQLCPLNDKAIWLRKLQEVFDDPGPQLEQMVLNQSNKGRKLRFDWNARIVSLVVG